MLLTAILTGKMTWFVKLKSVLEVCCNRHCVCSMSSGRLWPFHDRKMLSDFINILYLFLLPMSLETFWRIGLWTTIAYRKLNFVSLNIFFKNIYHIYFPIFIPMCISWIICHLKTFWKHNIWGVGNSNRPSPFFYLIELWMYSCDVDNHF